MSNRTDHATPRGRGTTTPKRTVLVDDVAELRELLRTLLHRDGRFTVVGEASTGREAVEVVGALRPDIVVLDIELPELDGISALPRLRERSPSTRIVMLSAHRAADMERTSLERGAVGYVEKRGDLSSFPSQLHTLAGVLDTVQRVLDATYGTDVSSPGLARRDVRAVLEAQADAAVIDVVELLSSELVTNAVKHARRAARVTAEVSGGQVRVRVTDDGPGTPVASAASTDAEGGRGLELVEVLSSAWGIEAHDRGKTVWFTLDL